MPRLAVLSRIPEAPGWVDQASSDWDVDGMRTVVWGATLRGEHGVSVEVEQWLTQPADGPVDVAHAVAALNYDCNLTAAETRALGDLLGRTARLLAAADLAVLRLDG